MTVDVSVMSDRNDKIGNEDDLDGSILIYNSHKESN